MKTPFTFFTSVLFVVTLTITTAAALFPMVIQTVTGPPVDIISFLHPRLSMGLSMILLSWLGIRKSAAISL